MRLSGNLLHRQPEPLSPGLQLALGVVVLGVSAVWPIRLYLGMPKSGYYNRPEERERVANRPRFNSLYFRGWALGFVAGLGLIVDALRKLAV